MACDHQHTIFIHHSRTSFMFAHRRLRRRLTEKAQALKARCRLVPEMWTSVHTSSAKAKGKEFPSSAYEFELISVYSRERRMNGLNFFTTCVTYRSLFLFLIFLYRFSGFSEPGCIFTASTHLHVCQLFSPATDTKPPCTLKDRNRDLPVPEGTSNRARWASRHTSTNVSSPSHSVLIIVN
jgi:hypothetical protein